MEPIDPKVKSLVQAIGKAETGDDPNAYQNRGASGEYGRYQFTEPTWKSYAKEILGDENADITSIENQNKVAYGKVKQMKDNGFTPAQIASVWNSGNPNAYKENHRGTNKFGVQYDVPAYVSKVSQNYEQLKGQTPNVNYSNQGVDTSTARETTIASGKPVSVNPNRVNPTLAGEIVRAPAKLLARGALNVAGTIGGIGGMVNAITGNEKGLERTKETQDRINKGLTSGYLGKVYPVGAGVDKEGKYFSPVEGNFGASVKDTLGTGLEAASYLPIAEGGKLAVEATKAGFKGLAREAAQSAGKAAIEGAIGGSLQGAGGALQEQKKLGQVALETGIGGITGGVLGGATGIGGVLAGKGARALAPGVLNAVEKLSPKALQASEKVGMEDARKAALEIAQSERTKETILKARKEGRYKSATRIKPEEIAPSMREQQIADELEPLIVNGELDTKAAPEVQAGQIEKKVSDINRGVQNFVNDNNVDITPNTFYAKISEKMKEAEPLFASEPQNQRIYDSLLSKYLEILGGDNSAKSHLVARKKFDSYMRKEFPGVVDRFISNRGQDVKANAYGDIRSSINELISEALPPNNPYKSQLLREHLLLSAVENLDDKIVKQALETGSNSKVGGLLKKGLFKAVAGTVGGTGIGTLGYLLGRKKD
jgi:hypothetical protein